MAKYISRFLSVVFVFLILLIDYHAWESSITNPPASMVAMTVFLFMQIPYMVIVGIVYLVLLSLKKNSRFMLEHLLVVSISSFVLIITTFILINI